MKITRSATTRLLAASTATVMALGLSVAPASAAPTGKPEKPAQAVDRDQAFNSFLDQLVAKGVITAAQASSIAAAMKDRRADRQAKMDDFSAKADALIAAHLGMTVEKFREARANRALPPLTPEQKTVLRQKLDALAQSLGLPRAPKPLKK